MYNMAPLSALSISPSFNLTSNICDSSPVTVEEVAKSMGAMDLSFVVVSSLSVDDGRDENRRASGPLPLLLADAIVVLFTWGFVIHGVAAA